MLNEILKNLILGVNVTKKISFVIKLSFKLIDATGGVIYDCHMFIVQATGVNFIKLFFLCH